MIDINNQNRKATQFAELHKKGSPLFLYNVWDAGSAKAVQEAGATAIATSSWAIAEVQGYKDGESIPFDLVEKIVERIVSAVSLPVTLDFEGGYTDDDKQLAKNIERILTLGVVGINFEDRVVQGEGLYHTKRQAERIAVIRKTAKQMGIALFINARTDVFFQEGASQASADEAISRAKSYYEAGASGLFIPGLTDCTLIKQIVLNTELLVNALADPSVADQDLACAGAARISYGATPYVVAVKSLKDEAKKVLAQKVTV